MYYMEQHSNNMHITKKKQRKYSVYDAILCINLTRFNLNLNTNQTFETFFLNIFIYIHFTLDTVQFTAKD